MLFVSYKQQERADNPTLIMSTHQMLATKTADTAAKTKTSLSTEQSQKLIQTMLTMSFGCLAFLRGLFPDENFVDQRFVPEKVEKNYRKQGASQSNSIKIKTLVRGKSNEADLLLNWLEKGVFQSIKLKYLKALSLGIFLNEDDPTDLLENYTFMFEYDGSDNFHMKVGCDRDVESISLLDSRKMAQQLMRRFIIITQSLEPLPQKKFLTLRLMFNDRAPPDYQPQLFRDATYDRPAVIKIPHSTDPDTFSVGSLDTKHHKISLKVLSAADCDADDCPDLSVIDPFDLIDSRPESGINQKVTCRDSVNSQTTNNLGDLLKSSQPHLQPTQAVVTRGKVEILCECEMDCPKESTALKVCKKCRKRVHGVCYGNAKGSAIEACMTCVYGSHLELDPADFKDLMLLRRCYRFIARRRTFPSSVSSFFKHILGNIELDRELEHRLAFCLSVLFLDGILVSDGQTTNNASQTSRKTFATVLVDWPGIVTPDDGELEQNREYFWSFCYSPPKSHSCITDVLAESRSQINGWLGEVQELRKSLSGSLPSSLNLQSLDIRDKELDSVSGKKRKHINLDQYLASSITYDTMDMSNEPEFQAPKKIRKISVSKKSLRSVW